MKLPKNIENDLKQFAQKSETDYDELLKEYESTFQEKWIQKDEFVDDEDRHQYLIGVFRNNYVARPLTKKYTVIPFGMTAIKREKQSKEPKCSIYAFTKLEGSDKSVLHTIRFRGIDMVKKIKGMTFLCKYEGVKLGKFESGDLIADDRAKFLDPERTNITYPKIIEKLNIPTVTIKEAINNLSKKDSKGYVVPTDLRRIIGHVKRVSENVEDPFNESCNYVLTDMSTGIDPITLPDGTTEYPSVTVWISKTIMKHEQDDMISVIGTIRERTIKDPEDPKKRKPIGMVSMDGVFTIGIHEKPREE